TRSVPIVFYAGGDPVAMGLVESLGKPGGRLTGLVSRSRELTPKRLELLKEIIPGLHRVVTFYNPDNPVSREGARLGREPARKLGVQLVERHVRSIEELRLALQPLKPGEVDAFFQTQDVITAAGVQLIIDAAQIKRLPTMSYELTLVGKGALAAYGSNNF